MFPAAIKPHLTLIFKFGGLLPLLIYTIFVSIFGGIIITAVIGLLVWDARQPLPVTPEAAVPLFPCNPAIP